MVVMALMRTVEQMAEGDTAEFAVASASELDLVRRWCEKTGNTLVSTLMVEQDTGQVTVGRVNLHRPASSGHLINAGMPQNRFRPGAAWRTPFWI